MKADKGPLARLSRAYRHIERMAEISAILVKFGFGDFLYRLGLKDLLSNARKMVGLSALDETLPRPHRIRLALENMGLVFIKLGQYLSTRDDVMPPEYIEEFSYLQKAVPPLKFDTIKEALHDLLQSGEIIKLETTPLASASIGQVHGACLKNGKDVVIKIKRPGLYQEAKTDLEIMAYLAQLVEKHIPSLALTRPSELVEEFGKGLLTELDYHLEALNLERFGSYYSNNESVHVPKIYRHLSNNRLIVMERVSGINFNETEKLAQAGFDFKELAKLGASIVFDQILFMGYFHADPHPGNILVQKGPKIALLDFGLVGKIDLKTRDQLLNLTIGAIKQKPQMVTAALLKLLKSTESIDAELLEREVEVFLASYLNKPLKSIDLSGLLNDAVGIIHRYQLAIPGDLLLLVKALIQVEGLCLQLDPEFDLTAVARPIILKLYRRRFTPSYWLDRLNHHSGEFFSFIENLPENFKPLFNNLRKGKIEADFKIEGLESLRQTIEQASYRLAFAVVLAALLIGSSVVIHSNIPPKLFDLPILGLLGFLGAGIVGFWLLYDYLKKKNL